MLRLNPYYSQFSSVKKLEGDSKPLMIREWLASINGTAALLCRDLYPDHGLMKTLPHINNDVYLKYMNNQPFEPGPVLPILPDNPDALQFQLYKFSFEGHGKFSAGLDILHKEILASLDDEIYTRLDNSGGNRGVNQHSSADIVSYCAETYDTIDKDMIMRQIAKVSKPFDKSIELATNFSNMERANQLLPEERRFNGNELFSLAFDNCSRPDTRLAPSAVRFRSQVGFNELTAGYEDFRDFILKDNSNQLYDPSTSALAFKDDRDYKPRIASHKLAFAATVDLNPDDDNLNLGLAATKMVTISEAEMKEFQKLKAKAAKAAAKNGTNQAAPAASTGPIYGKICFNCGWGNHNSKRCLVMYHAPAGTFTPAQRTLVKFSPSTDPHSIDGKAICQAVAAGYKPRE